MSGTDRVCPRCGAEADEYEFCQTCGLRLWDERELPTREDWETRRGAATVLGGRPAPGETALAQLTDWMREHYTPVRLGLVGAAIVAIFMIVAITGGGESDPGDASRIQKSALEDSVLRESRETANPYPDRFPENVVERPNCEPAEPEPADSQDWKWTCRQRTFIYGDIPVSGKLEVIVDEHGCYTANSASLIELAEEVGFNDDGQEVLRDDQIEDCL